QFSYQIRNGFRNSQISCGSLISRFSSWMRMRAMASSLLKWGRHSCLPRQLLAGRNACPTQIPRQNHPPGDTLEQKLENLDVPASLLQIAAPSIKAVTPNQVAVLQRVSRVIHPDGNLLG